MLLSALLSIKEVVMIMAKYGGHEAKYITIKHGGILLFLKLVFYHF